MHKVRLNNDALTVEIAAKGAEPQSILDAAGREWLWQGDPAFWGRRAPILFPMVGRAAGDHIRVDGTDYPLGQHGFARDLPFEVISAAPDTAHFRLRADAATKRSYPFDFQLDITFTLAGAMLMETARISNAGTEPMPAAIGFHPAFQWPLPGAAAPQTRHVIVFERAESADIRRLKDGGVDPVGRPTPVDGKVLALDPALFVEDALIFDRLDSRSVWFGVPGDDGLRVDFPDCPFLGIWTKPGASFLCIEPWQGHAAPLGFSGAFSDLPGVVTVAPGTSITRHMMLRIGAPSP